MAKTSVNIRFDDGQGGTYTIHLEGAVTKDKMTKVLEMYDLLSVDAPTIHENAVQLDTFYNKLLGLIKEQLSTHKFTSDEARDTYEDTYNEPVKLPTISTYLSRLTRHNVLTRSKNGRTWVYQLLPQAEQSPQIPTHHTRQVTSRQ